MRRCCEVSATRTKPLSSSAPTSGKKSSVSAASSSQRGAPGSVGSAGAHNSAMYSAVCAKIAQNDTASNS